MLRQLFSRMAAPAILFMWTIGAQGDTVLLQPSSTSVTLGSTFDLHIMAQDMYVGGYDFEIGFDAGLVEVTNVTYNESVLGTFDFPPFTAPPDILLDSVAIAAVSFLSNIDELKALQSTNPFQLATIRFQTKAAGLAEFSFIDSDITDPDAFTIDATLVGASVTITESQVPPTAPIPEPATWTVVAALGLIMLRFIPINR